MVEKTSGICVKKLWPQTDISVGKTRFAKVRNVFYSLDAKIRMIEITDK